MRGKGKLGFHGTKEMKSDGSGDSGKGKVHCHLAFLMVECNLFYSCSPPVFFFCGHLLTKPSALFSCYACLHKLD